MSPTQQLFLGTGSAAPKIYIDDVFSTYAYRGTNSNGWIQNGVGLHDKVEDRMVWLKNRGSSTDHWLFDTKRGANSGIKSHSTAAAVSTGADVFANNNFQSNGFVYGYGNNTGASNNDYSSWTFGTHPGFFDIIQYTGSGSTQSIAHNLGSIPGCIMVKRTDATADWGVYHRNQNSEVDPEDYRLRLNSNVSETNTSYWGDTAPTATHFTVGDSHTEVNASGGSYVAYILEGGKSSDATARSVEFDGSSDHLSFPDSKSLDV